MTWQLMNDRVKLAKYLFSLDAVLGILSIGGAALYGAAYSSKSVWVAFFPVFVPFSALWALFCYGAYKGLTSPNAFSKVVFWLFVVGHVAAFPVGTAISGACIWLWRGLSSHSNGGQGSVVAQQAVPADVACPASRVVRRG
jgi:hypothetical protein